MLFLRIDNVASPLEILWQGQSQKTIHGHTWISDLLDFNLKCKLKTKPDKQTVPDKCLKLKTMVGQ